MSTKLQLAFLVLALAAIYILGAFLPVFDVDSAQYAAISMEMYERNNYLAITERGNDYLDKPPFVFWSAAFCFSFLGINVFAYKFTTLCFALICIITTYRFATIFYDSTVATLSAIILSTSIGFYWANMDVKTDVILCASVIFSLYQTIQYLNTKKILHLTAAAIGIGIAMLTKGPIGIVVPALLTLSYILFQQDYKALFSLSWLYLLCIVALMLIPMCIGLYYQFDAHPEKIIEGKNGVSGLRFYFWEQSFGRITNQNKWRNSPTPGFLFYMTTIFLLPWSLYFVRSFAQIFIRWKTVKNDKTGMFIKSTVVLPLTILSFSHYIIPHYAIIALPFAAIWIASDIVKLPTTKATDRLSNALAAMLLAICGLFFVFFKPLFLVGLLYVVSVVFFFVCLFRIKTTFLHWRLVYASVVFGFVLNTHIAPNLQLFQEGYVFPKIITENHIPESKIFFLNRSSYAMEFNLEQRIAVIEWDKAVAEIEKKNEIWLYMSQDGKDALASANILPSKTLAFQHYDINRLSLKFLNPITRNQTLEPRYLLRFN